MEYSFLLTYYCYRSDVHRATKVYQFQDITIVLDTNEFFVILVQLINYSPENRANQEHPRLLVSEINAPVGSKEVMSIGRAFPLKTCAQTDISQSTMANCGCGQ